ncbi:hypothetical protein [Chryseolinea lacunae]|uniref:PKD domain-containing protein n=1 Tax=Chryseolinea lacunae TaxID=2801331 RepID=A0ABS1KP59_9BACT|nr:hypothetical protein [Chryseolinea lacunae]MBL0741125.1 hypothetical protein [Chryseolinea lacunae]
MSIANTFPVFEADQVLTNKHLNGLFNYLDQQDRLTRIKLLGNGIVCGLDISYAPNPGVISITKGCGVTSQGFLITFCDHVGEQGYRYAMPFTRPPFPNDLQLISQCGEPSRTNIPFYASPNSPNGDANNSILLLLTAKEFEALDNANDASLLPAAQVLEQYVVVLFLDVSQMNLKNCDTNDCNDKGSFMELEVKPLLVHKKLLRGGTDGGGEKKFKPVELRRYNVPAKTLASSDDVLNAFVALLDDNTLDRLITDLGLCFDYYKMLVPDIAGNPFGNLAEWKKNIQFILKSYPFLIQYYYDFVDDLIKSFYEFRYREFTINTECCGDEMRFPFHLALGEATATTSSTAQAAYRQYFIASPLFDLQGARSGELRSLLMRMILMYQNFMITEKTFLENREALRGPVKITPSQYGHHFLSERCIPFYYKVLHEKEGAVPGDLYTYWNFEKTKRGNARYNLGYRAPEYNQADTVVHPLNYDIEWFNFFRIEGHIGRNINSALTTVKSIQQNYNLPFDVVALSADYIGALVKGEDPECVIQDLESDYRVLIAEFICALHNPFCYVSKLGFAASRQGMIADFLGARAVVNDETTADRDVLDDTPPSALDSLQVVVDHPFIASLVGEFQTTAAYTKGKMLARLCAPAANTVGRFYITTVTRNNGKFVNPIPANATSPQLVLRRHFFEFVDSVESMVEMLMNNPLSSLEGTLFKLAYTRFETEVSVISQAVLALLKSQEASGQNNAAAEYLRDLFVGNGQRMLHTCIVEKLAALHSEYQRRLAQYRLARNFGYYFKRHGGLEHKAGVPKGGTFILVYHEERRRRTVDVNSLFVNQELSHVLLAQFKALLQPDVSLDVQEAKTKLLAEATLHKDPELYLRFRDVMKRYLDDCNDLTPDRKAIITGILEQPPRQARYEIPNGLVIADFYIPYLCCSDCPPIAYILSERPSITLNKEYCRNDKGPYTIEVEPPEGVLKIDGKKVPEDGFVPSAYKEGPHTVTYTVNNKTVSAVFTIVVPPSVKLSHEPNQNFDNTARFRLDTNARQGATFEWNYGDGKTLSTTDRTILTHLYTTTETTQKFAVTLTVADGPCKVLAKDSVTLNNPQIP